MPLKLAAITGPSSTNLLNKWADGQEATQNNQAAQISTLQSVVSDLQTAIAAVPATASVAAPSTQPSSSTGFLTVPGATIASGAGSTYNTGVFCNKTDVVSWCFQGAFPSPFLVVRLAVQSVGGNYEVVVQSSNPGAGSLTFSSFILNYTVI